MNNMTDMGEQLDAKLLLATLMALKKGDFSARMPSDWTGVAGKVADTLNEIIDTKEKMVRVVTEVSRVVGREGHRLWQPRRRTVAVEEAKRRQRLSSVLDLQRTEHFQPRVLGRSAIARRQTDAP